MISHLRLPDLLFQTIREATLSKGAIIGIAAGGSALLLVLLLVTCYVLLRRNRRSSKPSQSCSSTASSAALYYKFDPDSPQLPGSYSRTPSQPNASFPHTQSCISVEDAVYAPRALPSEVPSAGVAFLDDRGRPIAAPL